MGRASTDPPAVCCDWFGGWRLQIKGTASFKTLYVC
jgi:hypothetical protein